MKKLMIVLSILLIFGSSDLHGQTQRQITPADAYRMYQQRIYEQQQRAYQQQQQRYREQQQRYREQMRAYQQQQQRYQQQMLESQQRVRTAMWYRNPTVNPYSLNEGAIGGMPLGGGIRSAPVRRGPVRGYPRSDPYRSGNEDINRTRFEIEERNRAARSLQNDKLREKADQAEKARFERDSDRRQNERYMDRMASRATQATQPSRLSDRLGLAPKIEKRDLAGPFAGYLDSKALDRNVGRSTPQRSSAERSTPQRRDSQERSKSDNSSRSGRSPSSRDTRERSAPTCSTARC
jgi:hypothetical protein